jgi:hypothetical protein
MAKLSKGQTEIELVPDAWPRFEKFIKQVAKVRPQPPAVPLKAPPKPQKMVARKGVKAQSKKRSNRSHTE